MGWVGGSGLLGRVGFWSRLGCIPCLRWSCTETGTKWRSGAFAWSPCTRCSDLFDLSLLRILLYFLSTNLLVYIPFGLSVSLSDEVIIETGSLNLDLLKMIIMCFRCTANIYRDCEVATCVTSALWEVW